MHYGIIGVTGKKGGTNSSPSSINQSGNA